MAKVKGTGQSTGNAREADLAYDLWLAKRRKKGTKDYYTYGLSAKGSRGKRAMDYVAPGDGGY